MWKKNAKDVIDADNEIEDDYRFYSGKKKCTNKKNVCNNTKTKYIMVLFVGEPYRTS